MDSKAPPISKSHSVLHICVGVFWWMCLFSLNWQQKTELSYILVLLSPFFALFALFIVLPILSFFLSSRWIRIALLWVDGITLLLFGLYALNWQFFRSIVQAYLSIDAGNRYSTTGQILSFVLCSSILLLFCGFFYKKKSPTEGLLD